MNPFLQRAAQRVSPSPAACEHITTVKLTHLPRSADSKRSLLWLTITLYEVW